MTEQEMIVAFEKLLRERFDLDPEGCRESEDWWRFSVDGLSFQGGVHSRDFRVMTSLCELDPGADFDAVIGDANAASAELDGSLARFKEQDCYLYAYAQAGFAEVSPELLERLVRDCVSAAKSAQASKLRSKWRYWG